MCTAVRICGGSHAYPPFGWWSVCAGRLYLMSTPDEPAPMHGVHFFTMDKVMRYAPFCADFGPFNLGMTHHFCEVLRQLMSSPKMQKSKIQNY